MSRLIVNKNELGNTICVIRNLLTLEFVGTEVKVIDKYGLITLNIFDLDASWQIGFKNSAFTSGHEYRVYENGSGSRTWNVNWSIFETFKQLFIDHYFEQLEICKKENKLTLDNLTVVFNDDQFEFKTSSLVTKDKFRVFVPECYSKRDELLLLGENNFIYLNCGTRGYVETKLTLRIAISSIFCKTFYQLQLSSASNSVLLNFISSCLNTDLDPNVYLSVKR